MATTNSNDAGTGVWYSDMTNFVVMSDAGKPVFSRYGSEAEIARISGLFQALRGSILYNNTLEESLGDIQTIKTNSMLLVFLHVGSVTLVAIASQSSATEAYVRLQLEYLYSQLVFRLTEQVQQIFQQNTSFDLQSVLETDDGWIKSFLEQTDLTLGNPAPFLLCGNLTICPISSHMREKISLALEDVGNCTDDTLFALFFVENMLLSLVQPEYGPHLMRSTDLYLLLHFVRQQPEVRSSELWLPVCLPRFNSTGFLHCYTSCFDRESGLILALVSHVGTTEQFQIFHTCSAAIRRKLQIPEQESTVLQILGTTTASSLTHNGQHTTGHDIEWRRSDNVVTPCSDEDYVDASGDGDKMIPYVQPLSPSLLLEELQMALDSTAADKLYGPFLDIANALHFAYRYDAPVRTRKKRRRQDSRMIGCLTQTISSPIRYPLDVGSQQQLPRQLWNMYQRLSLRLRLGSACNESVQGAFAMLQDDLGSSHSSDPQKNTSHMTPGIGHHCLAMGLLESAPNFTGMASEFDGEMTYFGMNGAEFELYFACLGNIETKTAAVAGAKLARRIQLEQERLFVTKPATWLEK